MTPATAYVLSTGTALPGPAIDNEALCKRIDASPSWIDTFVGTRSRHFGVDLDSGIRTHSLADMATAAAAQAMNRADIDASEVGFLVLGTATPDHLMPTTANLVADALGLDDIPTFQLQSGCSGAIGAFDLGRHLLGDDRQLGLVIGADSCFKHLPLSHAASSAMSAAELINFVLFGDGAGAAVLSRDDAGALLEITALTNRFRGLGRDPGQQIEWFGLADRHLDQQGLNEDYKAIEHWVPRLSKGVLDELLVGGGLARDELDFVLPPQLSGRMTRRIVEQMEIPPNSREVSVVAETGNNGNALPFLQIDALGDTIQAGERAAVVAIESSKWIEGGMLLRGVA